MKDTMTFKCYMALFITVAVIGALYLLIYEPLPPLSKDAVLMVLGGLMMRLGDIFAYYFGSSEGSQRKTELLGEKGGADVADDQSKTAKADAA
jgi:CDP-diglyceride synthetase